MPNFKRSEKGGSICTRVLKIIWQSSYALSFNLQILGEKGSILDGISIMNIGNKKKRFGLACMGWKPLN